MVDNFCLQFYLCKRIPCIYRTCISKIRLSSHNLAIEMGRYSGISRNNRTCKFCNIDIEDEFHFILKCPLYKGFRKFLIKPYYWKKPSMYKYIQLLSSNNVK